MGLWLFVGIDGAVPERSDQFFSELVLVHDSCSFCGEPTVKIGLNGALETGIHAHVPCRRALSTHK